MSDKMRARTITDDVIEAMQRGVDEKIIRKLGALHSDIEFARVEDGYYNEDYLAEVVKALGVPAPQISYAVWKNGRLDYSSDYIEGLILEIRYRLTGHRETEIEDTD